MADVTVTLTQEESNFIHWMLDLTVQDSVTRLNRTNDALAKNGSLDGRFGEAVREADLMILNGMDLAIDTYANLRDKFEFDKPE